MNIKPQLHWSIRFINGYLLFFRKMTTEEKRKLGVGLSTLSPEDLNKALEIIAESNPNFQATGEVVDLDMDAQVISLS